MKEDVVSKLPAALGTAVLARDANGLFSFVVDPPPWYHLFWSDGGQEEVDPTAVFPFLDYFCVEAQPIWAAHHSEPLRSDPWSQADEQGVEHRFHATALTLAGQALLLITRSGQSDETRRQLLQKARINKLNFQRDMAAQKREEKALRTAQDQLEQCVAQRTTDLARVNDELSVENNQRRRAEARLIQHQNQLRRLASQLALAEERERRKIATGLHDQIGQCLAVAKIKLLSHRDAAASPDSRGLMDEILELLDQALGAARSLTFDLSPPTLYELGLEAALEGLAEQARARYGFSCSFQDDRHDKPVEEDIRVVLFQTARELLMNVAKHAKARHVTLKTERTQTGVRLAVSDDGVGFDTAQAGTRFDHTGGFGLFNLRERLKCIGGTFNIDSAAGRGTCVTIDAPLTSDRSTHAGNTG